MTIDPVTGIDHILIQLRANLEAAANGPRPREELLLRIRHDMDRGALSGDVFLASDISSHEKAAR